MSLPKTATDVPEQKKEIRLLFFGTFFHENTELTADLIQLKENAQITEIRVIPLGGTVDLSTGAFQLGATNPSEFDLEFYYNDLQAPTKTAFELLRNFKFNDKSRIQFICGPEECIITDGLFVRGVYSTATLAVYGFTVDKVPIKELHVEPKKETILREPEPMIISTESPKAKPLIEQNLKDLESFEKLVKTETESVYDVMRETELDVLKTKDSPQSIPTITTRVNYDGGPGSADESFPETEIKSGEASVTEESSKVDVPPKELTLQDNTLVLAPEVLEDMEEISDGEVFPSDDEEMNEDSVPDVSVTESEKPPPTTEKGNVDVESFKKIDPLIEEVEPISSPPQEQMSDIEDSLLDEFQEPGFEEIISDDDMPDFPDYDYGEWEEHWAHKFTKTFNPYSESFQVSRLRNIKISHTSNEQSSRTVPECWEMLLSKAEKHSGAVLDNLMESLIEDIEKLIPLIPLAVCLMEYSPESECLIVERALWSWIDFGTRLQLAMDQPSLPFKVRHIKAGIRLIQCIANLDHKLSDSILSLKLPVENEDRTVSVQQRLIDLLKEPNMKNTRLLILRAIDATISTRRGFDLFQSSEYPGKSCCQQLIECSLSSEFSTRMSFSLRSINKKIKIMQELSLIESYIKDIARTFTNEIGQMEEKTINQWTTLLCELNSIALHIDQYFSFPLRILPANFVVQLPPLSSSGHDPKVSFVKMLKEYNFIQVATVILNSKNISGLVVTQIAELIEALLQWEAGLMYLCNEEDSTTLLLRSLFQCEEDVSNIASLVSHCMEVMKCVDILSSEGFKTDSEEERDQDIQILQVIVTFLSSLVGREALVNCLSKGNFILPILKCVQTSENDPRFGKLSSLEMSARRGYAVEILEFVVRSCDSIQFLEKHGAIIHNIISSVYEKTEGCEKLADRGVGHGLLDVQGYLKPSLKTIVFTLDGVEALCDIIKTSKDQLLQPVRNSGNNWGIPGELITSLRILSQLVNPPECNELLVNTDEFLVRQLKYDLASVRIHFLDMIPTIVGILQKVVEEFLLPTIYSHVLVGTRGNILLSLFKPSIKLLQRVICHVIKVRKTEFRDTTPVPVLIKVYSLIYYFPQNAISFSNMQKVGRNIIETLLAYTVPAVKQGAETEEELNKSTWTAMVSAVIKFTLEEPINFQPGLALFSELLPLPLPISSKSKLSDEVCLENVKLRRLWSAYIHVLSSQLQDMIGILSSSSNAKLLNLLKRTCVQLADLSSSSCLVVCRAILDAILQSIEIEGDKMFGDQDASNSLPSSQSVKIWVDTSQGPGDFQCTMNTARLLGFLASLVSNYPPIKCGILHALKGTSRIDEKYTDILPVLCSMLLTLPTNTTSSSSNSQIQGQDNTVTIFQSFCDVEINMLTPIVGQTEQKFDPQYLLANSLPQRESMVAICSTLLKYISMMNIKISNNIQVVEGILRTMEIVAESDYGFYHLKTALDKSSGGLLKIATSLVSFEVDNSDNTENFEAVLPCIMSFLDLMKTLVTPRSQQMGSFPPRLSYLKQEEMIRYLQWGHGRSVDSSLNIKSKVEDVGSDVKKQLEEIKETKLMDVDSSTEIESMSDQPKIKVPKIIQHPLTQLKSIFEDQLKHLKSRSNSSSSIEVPDLENSLGLLENLLQYLEETKTSDSDNLSSNILEVVLPSPEPIAELYSVRPVFVLIDRPEHDTLPVFWITGIPPAFELDSDNAESDLINCNLEELSRTHLLNFDVGKEIEILIKTSTVESSKGKEESKITYGDGAYKGREAYPHMPHTGGMMHFQTRRHQFGPSMRGSQNRGGGFSRGLLPGPRMGNMMIYDPFRSRPPNTSRPPSLHVDDFVALEGQPGGGSMRPGGSESYTGRGRGNSRGGGLLTRPYAHDRGGRNPRSAPGQGGYYQSQRHDPMAISKGRVSRGGRVYSTPTSDRWTADNRSGSQNYDRNNRSSNYRSGSVGPTRSGSVTSSPRTLQPYPQRSGYRDARSNTNPRFRERPKPFNNR